MCTLLGVEQYNRELLVINSTEVAASPFIAHTKKALPEASGPLRIHPDNPRYFSDGTGKGIMLSGLEFWDVLRLDGKKSPGALSWNDFLTVAESHGVNFIRLWVWNELTRFRSKPSYPWYTSKEIWLRTGRGNALDGKPKFDLTKFNQAFFDELRSRVIQAGENGFYVSVMLFEGWSLRNMEAPWRWDAHPFNRKNNIQGIDGNPNEDSEGIESHTLEVPVITYHQERYVRKVIDTVNDLDNVLYEISNEDHPGSTEWQHHITNYIKNYERKHKAKQHPVWMSALISPSEPSEKFNERLWNSRADCISPGGTVRSIYVNDPPEGDGSRVVISDSDHFGGIVFPYSVVWKSFTRGLNVVNYMELPELTDLVPMHVMARNSMGHVLKYSQRIDLQKTRPRGDLSSTGYTLVNPGKEYLIYLPSSECWGMTFLDKFSRNKLTSWFVNLVGLNESATVDLSASSEKFDVEWFNPRTGATADGGTVTGGGERFFTSPFVGDSVLYVYQS